MKNIQELSDSELVVRQKELENELERRKNSPEMLAKEAEIRCLHNIVAVLEGRDPRTKGIWTIYGEDPNCDMGGPHHEPVLGHFEGKLGDVVEKAFEIRGFGQWRGYGRVVPMKVEKVTKL